MESISNFNYILSSDESDDQIDDSESNLDKLLNLDSPIVKFPEKIKHTKYLQTEASMHKSTSVPKLDLGKVLTKYQPIKHVDIAE